jgi:hypothetical protein
VQFYSAGAKYIKEQYDLYFINAKIAIRITSDVNVNGDPYEFNGFLNMALYSEMNSCDSNSWSITVGIIDDNFREQFKSRENVEISLIAEKDLNSNPIPLPVYDEITTHTQDLYFSAYGENLAQSNVTFFGDAVVPIYWGSSDFKNERGSTIDSNGYSLTPFPQTNVHFKNNADYGRTIKINCGHVVFQAFNTPENYENYGYIIYGSVIVKIWDETGDYNSEVLLNGPFLLNSGTFNYEFDLPVANIYLPAGYSFTLVISDNGPLEPCPIIDPGDLFCYPIVYSFPVLGNFLNIGESNSGASASITKGFMVENMFRRIIYILTGNPDGLVSDTFSKEADGCYWNNFLTNGLLLRNAITVAELSNGCDPDVPAFQQYKTSFRKLFEGLDRILGLGWGFEQVNGSWKIRIESREYFFTNTIGTSFENVERTEASAMSDKLINQIKIGYNENWKNISISGIFAIHTQRNYYINNRAMAEGTTSELDLTSEIIGEGQAIEFSRRLQFLQDDSGSSDRPNDFVTFIIWVNRPEKIFLSANSIYQRYVKPGDGETLTFPPGTCSVAIEWAGDNYGPIGGIYNVIHTPARIAIRLWRFLGMYTYGLSDEQSIFKFQSGEYQTTYQSRIIASFNEEPCYQGINDVLREDADIGPNLILFPYNKYLFRPIEIKFEYPQELCNFLTTAEVNQYELISASIGGTVYYGWIVQLENQPNNSDGGVSKFTILASNLSLPNPPVELGAYSDAYSSAYS